MYMNSICINKLQFNLPDNTFYFEGMHEIHINSLTLKVKDIFMGILPSSTPAPAKAKLAGLS